jgi:5-oxoprolinase (ATP-hydrolysing) subunit C
MPETTEARITVVDPGLASVQDLGRVDGPRSGQMTGGALDQYSARMANALVASGPDAALIELVAQDFAATADADLLVAVTGADADVTIDGCPHPQWEPIVWREGTTLAIRRIRCGLRVYLAVHGFLHAGRLLGSCAPDTVLGFGGTLARGAVLTVAVDCPPVVQPWFDIPFFRLGARPHPYSGLWNIDLTDGPDAAEFGGTAGLLTDVDYTVGIRSNHIGLRLSRTDRGPLPRREVATEVLSRGVPIGAVEVPDGDEILVLHRGRGVTAGYPVLAVATSVGLSRLGQARPGDRVRFRHVACGAAVADYRRQQAHLAEIRARVRTVYSSLGIPLHFTTSPNPDRQGHSHRTSTPSVPELQESA